MKITYGHFFTQNTPPLAKIIGDLFLGFAVLGAAIHGFELMAQAFVPPLLSAHGAIIVVTISNWFVCVGATIKAIAMGFGMVDSTGNPVSPLPISPAQPPQSPPKQ